MNITDFIPGGTLRSVSKAVKKKMSMSDAEKAAKRKKTRKTIRKTRTAKDKEEMAAKKKFKTKLSTSQQMAHFPRMKKKLDAAARRRARQVGEAEIRLATTPGERRRKVPAGLFSKPERDPAVYEVGQEPGDPGLFPAAPEYRLDRKKGGKVKKKAKAKSKAFNGNDFVIQANNYKEM